MTQSRKTPAAPDAADPRDVVVLARAHLQEVFDAAVARGRLTRADAADLVEDLLAHGRDDVLGDLELLVARAPVDASGVAGLGVEFPIAGYDDLTAAEVVRELEGMSERDLRKVRTYERANANRKSVLGALDRKLA